MVSFVFLNPSFGNDTEAVIDKFCAILPTHEEEICENVAHKISVVLQALTQFLGVHEQESVHFILSSVSFLGFRPLLHVRRVQ